MTPGGPNHQAIPDPDAATARCVSQAQGDFHPDAGFGSNHDRSGSECKNASVALGLPECRTVLVGFLRSAGIVVPFVCLQNVIDHFETMLNIRTNNETGF